jgi:hypothetical protein
MKAMAQRRQRKHRARTTPQWLQDKEELDEIAQRRTLMILEVLSGKKPVTDAISEAQISRGHYYQLEEKALRAILTAMEPGASPGRPPETTTRLLQLEEKVQDLENDKRRLERLLSMTRKVLRPGPMKTGLGRPRSAKAGKNALPPSSERKTSHGAGSPTSSSEQSIR